MTGLHVADDTASRTSSLVAIALDDPLRAQEGLLAAMRLVKRGHLELEDAAIITKEAGGRLRIQETKDTRPGQGAASGGWLGMLAGFLLGGGALLVGAALGAAAGGIFAKLRDIGIQDSEMQQLGEELAEGEAALLLLIEHAHMFHARGELRRFPGRLLQTTCDEDTAESIRDALGDDPYVID